MRDLARPLAAVGIALVLLLVVVSAKRSSANDRIAERRQLSLNLERQLALLATRRADTGAIRSQSGTEAALAADELALRGRLLPRSRVPALFERLRAAVSPCALGSFDQEHAVRDASTAGRPGRLSKLTVLIEITTDWPRLGALVSQMSGLAPTVVLEEATVHRAEEVPLLGVRLVLAALVAEDGLAAEPAVGAATRLEGSSPFFLASELESGKSHRQMAVAWTPPRVMLQGVVFAPTASQVIVNDEPVFVGQSFVVGGDTVRVLAVAADRVRFQVGERIFERALPPLGK